MRRGARQSQIINNFFSLATIVMVVISIVLYTKFIVEPKKLKEKKIIPLLCEKEVYTFSKVYNQKLLNKSIKALDTGYYKLDGAFLKSEFMKSKIEDIISLEEINKFYINNIGSKPRKNIKKYLKIKYEIIENDKKKPNKKNKDYKLNSGSILTSFRINSTEIFRIYTDFNFMFKNEIERRVTCSIKVFKNHVKK